MSSNAPTLDPTDWAGFRQQGRRMLDDMFDQLERLESQPVWTQPPETVRRRFDAELPYQGTPLESVHESFLEDIAPYASGNRHSGFMGWVQGGGTPVGMLAEMLAAGLNANVGGRNHMAIEVERQIVRWMSRLFHFPADASGLFLTGSSMANFCAVLVARTRLLGRQVRERGVADGGGALCAYTSAAAHGCIRRALEMSGSGGEALRTIAVDARHRMNVEQLRQAIKADCEAGLRPFMVVATAGTVDIGAIDDLAAVGAIAREEGLHFHIDGAFGALGVLSEQIAPRLVGIELADSIALDFHKWAQVPYDAGFLLVRDQAAHRATFSNGEAYLSRAETGLAGGEWWPCDFGPDLSRGFRALKVWFSLKTYGLARLGEVMDRTCALAQLLASCVEQLEELELLAPVGLNIVCFRYLPSGRYGHKDVDALNSIIVEDLHLEGRVAPSLTSIDGRSAIRAAIVNHRTSASDIQSLLVSVLRAGRRRLAACKESETLAA